jgi:hypothetical protein
MTRAEWFAATDPELVLRAASESARARSHPRLTRLFACGCVRQVWHLLPTDARSAVQISERLAEGRASEIDMRAAALPLPQLAITPAKLAITAAAFASLPLPGDARLMETELHRHWPLAAAVAARALASEAAGPAPLRSAVPDSWHVAWTRAHDEARATQAAFVRDIFPPPKYTPHLDPHWRTSTVLALARQMDESGDFSIAPIFADALQDAGCEDETVLQCCRVPGNVHVRGNWVVDLVLGRT